ncbi:GNAT family N-acetyltransferase [Catenulispora subtropica]|uniref:N-acetyltransferase domain-containing protein n=1 Tax=Catenulispora subtropica TaxID=450798 RepID=A0ABP5CR37_9ACTN
MGTNEPPRLRGVLKEDLSAIADLEATAFGTNGLTRNALDVIFDPSGAFWLLAEDEEGVWGHSVNARGEDPHVGWILGMAVHPERQGRGWGRILLQASIDRLQDSDINVIRLLVKRTNKLAYRLYESFGFVDSGERADHFGPGEDRLVMSLLLSTEKPPKGQSSPPFPQVPVDPQDTGRTLNGVAAGPQIPRDDAQKWYS